MGHTLLAKENISSARSRSRCVVKRASLQLLLFVLIFIAPAGLLETALARKDQAARTFQGKWLWAEYASSKSELPPAYQDRELKQVPYYFMILDLAQKGNILTGRYAAGARFAAKVEDGEFKTRIRGGVAKVTLESGFGGKVKVELMLKGNRLSWKTIASEGENYFPGNVILSRIKKEPGFDF